jgi:hypothetical protein
MHDADNFNTNGYGKRDIRIPKEGDKTINKTKGRK